MIYRGLQHVAGRWPRTAVAAATVVGWATRPLGRGLSSDAILRFFPELDAAGVRRLQAATWSSWVRMRVLEAATASPRAPWPYPPILACPDPATLPTPVVLASFHLGPHPVLGALLERMPGRVLVMRLGESPRRGMTANLVGHDRWQRAAAFRRGLDALRQGDSLLVLADANVIPSTVEVVAFGRRTSLARGAFALARISNCPVIPLAARWRGAGVEIVAGEPIPPGPEAEMAAATMQWLEAFVRESPEEIGQLFVNTFWGTDVPVEVPKPLDRDPVS